ncbi:hybrid sensor histidine kinase/response regulator [Candidatus Nitrospira allomarina]|uniref:histidine kinase n=1 Tax=Candidatus Nitrospira allomarina TaxID=3020900 RepID=A0AA96GDF9_9BACT|nr:response regulator [Candidatus Nitrospira allomarina]WNM59092.1 response regulator [Candidatus Nitrospira allomarina]
MTMRREWLQILIVQDRPDQLEVLVHVLGEEGYQVVGARTAAEASEYAKCGSFAVAVVDVQTPDVSEVSLLSLLRTNNAEIQMILSQAFASLDSAKDAIGERAVAYLKREASTSELLSTLRRTFRDQLTEYTKGLEIALAERDERFRQLVDHIKEVFWVFAPDQSEIWYISPQYETVWGRSCASLLENPQSLWNAIHHLDQPRFHKPQFAPDVHGVQGECRIVRPDNSMRWVRIQTVPIRKANGDLLSLAGVAEDITERKRVEEALTKTERQFRQSSRMEAIGTLAGGIAHDFNNILTAILGYTELALATVPKESRTQRNLQEVLTAGHRAKHLVLQILTFSRQAGQGKKPTPFHMVIREALKLLRSTIPTTIEIRQVLNTEATILADPTQMHQIIINLCTNAEYAMREHGGILTVSLEDLEVTEELTGAISGLHIGPHVRLTVKDTGLGMTPEVLERLFDPFFTTKPIGEGSGMGMAVVHGIITGHKGAIVVDSIVNKGTTIDVYLPTVPTQALEPVYDQKAIPTGKESVLFVDDEETIVRLGKELLTQLGYTVEVHTSSIEALRTFRQDPHRFDLVITDQTMPGLTGEALSRELLRIRPDLPIILCTGFSHVISAERAKALGIQGYLMKPLAIRDLVPIIRHVLDKTSSSLAES